MPRPPKVHAFWLLAWQIQVQVLQQAPRRRQVHSFRSPAQGKSRWEMSLKVEKGSSGLLALALPFRVA
jgi:hypothetical protein